jgi:predicted phosphodiesterase
MKIIIMKLLVVIAILLTTCFAYFGCTGWKKSGDKIILRIGLITDIHYAMKPSVNNRYYSYSLPKARQAIDTFNSRGTDFLVLLGDIIDETDKKTDIENLKTLDDLLAGFSGPRHYVMGNHDLGDLTKEEFLTQTTGEGKSSYYSFSNEKFLFIVLDGNFRIDGTEYSRGNFHWTDSFIPSDQKNWLIGQLEESRLQEKTVIVFVHQILRDENDDHGVKNANEIRNILEQSDNVLAVFQGHDHHGSFTTINGIHYVGIHPMVVGESNAYAELTITSSGKLSLEGFGRQPGIEFD